MKATFVFSLVIAIISICFAIIAALQSTNTALVALLVAVVSIGVVAVAVLSTYLERYGMPSSNENAAPSSYGHESASVPNENLARAIEKSSNTFLAEADEIKTSLLGFQQKLDEKDKEINRYREGFDIQIYRRFLMRFYRAYKFLNKLEEPDADSIPKAKLTQLKNTLEDAFEESGVEFFTPEIGVNYLDNKHIFEDNPDIMPTDSPEQDGVVADVITPGLRGLEGQDDNVIIKAKAQIFKYTAGKDN